MPKILNKTITLNKWFGGLANIDLDMYSKFPSESSYSQEVDIDSPHLLRPTLAMVEDGAKAGGGTVTSATARIIGYARGETDTNNYDIYCVVWDDNDDDLEIWAKDTLTGVWNTINDDTTGVAAEPPYGLHHYNGNLYYFNGPQAITQYDISGDTADTAWDSLNVAGWGSATSDIGGAVLHNDGFLYFWKGQYIGPYDGSSKPSTITPHNLGDKWQIVDAIPYGNQILIAANDVDNARHSRLFLLDPYQALGVYTFDDQYDTNMFNIQTIRELEGTVKVINALDYCQISDWMGGNVFRPVKRLSVGAATQSFNFIRQTAVATNNNLLIFGTHNTNADFDKNGIYTYGRSFPGVPQSLSLLKVNENDNPDDLDHLAILPTSLGGLSNFYMSWYDQTNYHASRIGTARSTKMEYETVWFRPFPGLKSIIAKSSLFHEDLGASGSITIAHKKDADAAYSTIFAASGDDSYQTVVSNNRQLRGTATLSNAFTRGAKHKLKITMTNGVALEKIKLRCRTVEQD